MLDGAPDPRSLAQQVADTGQSAAVLEGLSDAQLTALLHDWSFWGRPAQFAPPGDWQTWLILAGRGFGKTRAGAEWVRSKASGKTPLAGGSHSRFAIIAETAADCRDVLVEGDSGILSVHPKDFRPTYEPSKRRLTWPNGAVGTLYNATEPDQLRGPQHDAAWMDELAKWKRAQETFDQAAFGLRLGESPQQIITTTPRPIPLIKKLHKQSLQPDSGVVLTAGSTYDNAGNLAATFIKTIRDTYEGTRLGRQELEAAILGDLPGALWTQDVIDKLRVMERDRIPTMQRIVVAVDPSGTRGEEDEGDSIGIVVAGIGIDREFYVFADRTCKLGPSGWGRRVVNAYHEFDADRVVAETNFGGAMVESVIRTIDKGVSYREVKASRGKVVRAEPISALYEQGRVHHCGIFDALEDQMCNTATDGYAGEGSPDRMDALVWAITELKDGSSYTLDNL